MPEFTYQALDERKQFATGQLHAASMTAAVEQLTKLGYIPLSTKPSTVARISVWKKVLQPRVTQRDVTILLQDLAQLLHSGLPLDDALKLQADNASPGLTRLLHQLRSEVESGGNFADALKSHRATAAPELIAIVKSAEAAGDLGHALRPLSEERSKQEKLADKISAAVRYPLFLLFVAVGVLAFFLLFVVPQFADAVRDIGGGHAGWSVMTVIAISDHLQANGFLIVMVGLAFACPLLLAFWHPHSRNQLAGLFSQLPGIRGIVALHRTSHFCRGLGMLLSNGVTLTDALRLLSDAQIGGNHLKLIADHIRRGGRLVDAIAETTFLPPLATRMLRVGEETGSLDVAAKRCAEYYQTKLTERIDKLANIVGPAAIVVISTVVGTLIVAIMSTLLSINQMAL